MRRISSAEDARRRRPSARRREDRCAAGHRLLAFGERLEHPVRDVDARAAEYGFLHDQVELVGFGDLLDDAVGNLEQLCQLLVAAQVEVLPVLPLYALEVDGHALELLLLAAALALGHGHRFLLEAALQRLDLGFPALELLHARRELLFELPARTLRRG